MDKPQSKLPESAKSQKHSGSEKVKGKTKKKSFTLRSLLPTSSTSGHTSKLEKKDNNADSLSHSNTLAKPTSTKVLQNNYDNESLAKNQNQPSKSKNEKQESTAVAERPVDWVLPNWNFIVSNPYTVDKTVTKDVEKSGTKEVEKSGTKELKKSGTKEVEKSGTKELKKSGTKEVEKSGTKEIEKSGTKELKKSGTKEVENFFRQEQHIGDHGRVTTAAAALSDESQHEYPEQDGKGDVKIHSQRRHSKSSHHTKSYKASSRRKSSRNHHVDSPLLADDQNLLQLVDELSRNCEKYRKELKIQEDKSSRQILSLQNENENLQLNVYQLSQDLEDWKSKYQRQQNKSVALAKAKTLSRENQHLQEDIGVLKSVIRRLNREITFYQDKLRDKFRSQPAKIPVYSSSASNSIVEDSDTSHNQPEKESDAWLREPQKKLQPLLQAYDEVIEEKNDIIKDHEAAIERFKARCQEIVRENEELHKIIGQSKEKGSVSIDEWTFLFENASVVLEENDLLHNQVEIAKEKLGLLQKIQEEKASKLKSKIKLQEEENIKIKSTNSQYESHCVALSEKNSQLAQQMEQQVPREQYETSVYECKKLFEDLKLDYDAERTTLKDKIVALEKERERLVIEITNLEAENGKLQENVTTLENNLLATEMKHKELHTKMIKETKSQEATAATVNEMMELTRDVISQRESLENSLQEQRDLNEQMMSLRTKETELVAELQGKIKVMENLHRQETQKLIHKVKELENILDSIGDRQHEETAQLKELIQEKSKRIELLQTEKRQLESDLETVWRATTKDRGASLSEFTGRT